MSLWSLHLNQRTEANIQVRPNLRCHAKQHHNSFNLFAYVYPSTLLLQIRRIIILLSDCGLIRYVIVGCYGLSM